MITNQITDLLLNELINITITEPDTIIELPFETVKKDCFNVVQELFDVDLHTHQINFVLNQDQSWFDLPNTIYLRCNEIVTTPDIILTWHELFHYAHSLIEDLENVHPLYWEYLPTIGEELCIQQYDLKCQEHRASELREYIALSLIDQSLLEMKEVNQVNFYELIEEVQNITQVNISVDMLEVLMGTRYTGYFWGYVLSRALINSVDLTTIV